MLRRLGLLILMTLTCFSGGGCVSAPWGPLWSVEKRMLFHPRPHPPGSDACDHGFEDATFTAADGAKLHGWYAEAPQARAVVLYHHGNAGNVASRAAVLRLFHDRLRTTILIYDYRGFGKSQGEPSEQGILADARAARRWLAQRTGVSESDIVHVGNSLGGGVAVDLATDGARGLVLENTFTSLPDVASSHLPWLPASLLMNTRLDSAKRITNYHGPLLQTHGDKDEVVPFELGRRLFAAAHEPKQFVAIPRGGHNDPPAEAYLQALDAFLERLPR